MSVPDLITNELNTYYRPLTLFESMPESDAEKGDSLTSKADNKAVTGLSQSSKDDIGVCVVIILITILAIIVTVVKIVLFDRENYPELFMSTEEYEEFKRRSLGATAATTTTTGSPTTHLGA